MNTFAERVIGFVAVVGAFFGFERVVGVVGASGQRLTAQVFLDGRHNRFGVEDEILPELALRLAQLSGAGAAGRLLHGELAVEELVDARQPLVARRFFPHHLPLAPEPNWIASY